MLLFCMTNIDGTMEIPNIMLCKITYRKSNPENFTKTCIYIDVKHTLQNIITIIY